MRSQIFMVWMSLVFLCAACEHYGGGIPTTVYVHPRDQRHSFYILQLSDWDLNGRQALLDHPDRLANIARWQGTSLHEGAGRIFTSDYRYILVTQCAPQRFLWEEFHPVNGLETVLNVDCTGYHEQ